MKPNVRNRSNLHEWNNGNEATKEKPMPILYKELKSEGKSGKADEEAIDEITKEIIRHRKQN